MNKWNCPNIEDRKEDQSIPVAPNNNYVESISKYTKVYK